MENFVRFQTMEFKINLSPQKLGKTEKQRPLMTYMYPISIIVISDHMYVYVNLCAVLSYRNRSKLI